MSSSSISKIPIIGFNIKKLAKTPVGLRLVIVRKLQERIGELAMSRFITHSTDNLALQKATLDGYETTINALTLFSTIPALLSVFGNQIRYTEFLHKWFLKYPIYREWLDLQDGKIKITNLNNFDIPVLNEILDLFNIKQPVHNIFTLAKHLPLLITEYMNQIQSALDVITIEPDKMIDYLNQKHNKIKFPLELALVDKNIWILAIPTLFLEYAVLSASIHLWWAYKIALDNAIAKEIKKEKALVFPRIKNVDLGALPIKLDIGGKTKKVQQFLTYGERRFSINVMDLDKGVVANMFGVKKGLPNLIDFYLQYLGYIPLENEHYIGSAIIHAPAGSDPAGSWKIGALLKNNTSNIFHKYTVRVYQIFTLGQPWIKRFEAIVDMQPTTTIEQTWNVTAPSSPEIQPRLVQVFHTLGKNLFLQNEVVDDPNNTPPPGV